MPKLTKAQMGGHRNSVGVLFCLIFLGLVAAVVFGSSAAKPKPTKPTPREIAAEYVRSHKCTPRMEWKPFTFLRDDGSLQTTAGKKTYDCEGVYVEVENQ